jgi:putative DNA primase/helicase
MVAEVLNMAGHPVACHRTYLTRDGGKAGVDPVKASLGPVWGGAVRLDQAAPELVIGEGIETAASAGLLLRLPAWAAISAGNLGRGLVLPSEVRAVVIAADPDPAGKAAAAAASTRWQAEGRHVRIATPDQSRQDFNDVLQERARRAAEVAHG